MMLKVTSSQISNFAEFIDFYEDEKEYETRMYQLYNFALENSSFDDHDKFERCAWFYFIQLVIKICRSTVELKEQIFQLELEKLKNTDQ